MKSLLLFLFLAQASHAAVYKLSASEGKVSFRAKGRPALIAINGIGEGATGDVTAQDDGFKGEITFSVESLKTGISLRDEHMKNKYLQVAQYPKATLKLSKVDAPKGMTGTFPFTGTLLLHGVEKPIKGEATLAKDGDRQTLKADFQIKLSEFKIDIPSFQGITVAEDVQVSVESVVKKSE